MFNNSRVVEFLLFTNPEIINNMSQYIIVFYSNIKYNKQKKKKAIRGT